MITVDVHEAERGMAGLLEAVEIREEVVVICWDGRPVAELRASDKSLAPIDPLKMHPELVATILYDPVEFASEDEWSEGSRSASG